MSIDTDLPGKPRPVYDVADWLLALGKDLKTCATQTGRTAGLSTGVWTGDSGDAYRDFNADLKTSTTDVQERVDACEKTTRAYGDELKARLDDMGTHRRTARSGGLTVVDKVIQEPLGGAHRDPHTAAHSLEQYIAKTLRDLKRCKIDNLVERRYEKFRDLGTVVEAARRQTARAAG